MSARRLLLAALALASAIAPAARLRGPLPDAFVLGRDATGEPCTATRNWRDPRLGDAFDAGWTLTCRGVAAARPQGYVLQLRPGHEPAADPKRCGEGVVQTIEGIGKVETRSCYDPSLAAGVLRVRFERGGHAYLGAGSLTALGPLEALLRTASRVAPPPANRDVVVKPTLLAERAPAPPAGATVTNGRTAFDPVAALQAGIQLNHRGLYVEASRLLNDGLSRLDVDAPPLTRVEAELEAGLADSNISQFDAADDHFDRATALLAANSTADRAAALQAKRATYRGLDLLNRREWSAALAAMADTDASGNPLRDVATLGRLNQAPPGAGASAALSAVDSAQFARLMLEAQRNWARSVALLALGRSRDSNAALNQASAAIEQLQRNVDAEALVAVKSRVQRQYGRVAARDGRVDQAVAMFDCAITTLQGLPPSPTKPCPLDRPGRRAGTLNNAEGAMIAETELERASILARKPGVPAERLLADYNAGVDALVATAGAGGVVPPSLEAYLDTLARLDAEKPSEDLAERYFRTVQAVGEPAIARQLAQLQSVVTADSALGAKVRDRGEVERQIVQLRYAIATASDGDTAGLEAQRRDAEAKLAALNAVIASDSRYRAVDDQPATIRQVRSALKPGEVYLKISRLRSRAWATVISNERSWIYPLAASGTDVDSIADRVRASIRDESGRLPFFDVPASFALFRLLAGPAQDALTSARAIIFDPSGALQNLPAGVLVIDQASVRAYLDRRREAPNDYSHVGFLAAHAEISNALSPRSFLIARSLPASAAPRPFIGFGENAPPVALSGDAAMRPISFGTGCAMPYGELAAIMSANQPVPAHELAVAATALGDPQAPEVTGRAFTDTAVIAASEAGDYLHYQVVHFATHGVPETRSRCTVVPPSLVTTLAPPAPPGQPQSDGLLTFAEIARLRLDANLVVLSACETAAGVSTRSGRLAGQDESAATLDGLVRAFITANARAVLATFWKVPAVAGSEDLMRTFYESGRTATIGGALQRAKASLIAQPAYSHPYYWGAYFLVGDGSKTMLSRPPAVAPAVRAAAS